MSERTSLKREISLLGSFAMGFADVGADVFLAIGIVAAYAAGASPIAFLLASVCYITTGLVYAELTSLYPYAGGGQVFGAKAGGDLLGFIVGWSLLMSYVIDIGLFSIISAGYLAYILPFLKGSLLISLLGLNFELSLIGVTALLIVIFLIFLNIIGIKESSLFNEIFVVLTIATETLILILAFPLAFNAIKFLREFFMFGSPDIMPNVFYTGLFDVETENFIYSVTIAMSSFVGIESIAQAAEETRNPWRYIPRAFKYSIIAVLALTFLFSSLGIGVLGWRSLAENVYNPIATIAEAIPVVGPYLSIFVAAVAFAISTVSTNTGVIGVSRVVYSMSKFKLLPKFLSKLHKKRATPYIGIIIFGIIGGVLALSGAIHLVASLYSFGALLSYLLVNYCHILLRKVDKDAYRPWKTPINIRVGDYDISIMAILGVLSTGILFILTVIYHAEGRLLGLIWVIIGVIIFYLYRLYSGEGFRLDISKKLIPSALPYIRVLVYVPLFANPAVLIKRIRERLSEVNEIHLVSVIPRHLVKKDGVDEAELTRLKRSQIAIINRMKSKLEDKFRCSAKVLVSDDVEEALSQYVSEYNIDQVAVPVYKRKRIKRKTEKFTKLKRKVQILFLSG